MARTQLCCEALDDRITPANLPTGFTETNFISGLTNPVAMTATPDGRWLVCEQGGTLRVVKDGTLLATPFVSLPVNSSGERGLLGVAVDPNFASNGFVYVYHTIAGPTQQHHVTRLTANGDIAATGSELTLITIPDSAGTTNHNGGALHFGSDGKLYVAVGDDANPTLAQQLTNLHGKVLRLNSDGSIPTDNPFFGSTTGVNRSIWAYGLRNPFTFAVQPGTGRIYINDVGQNSFEEINEGAAGRNFGWPGTEGTFNPGSFPNFTNPVFAYPHGGGNESGFAITGGVFYNPTTATYPADYVGKYLFADLTNDWVRRLDPATGTVTPFITNLPGGTVDLDVDPNGSLYILNRSAGIIRIDFPTGQTPPTTTDPANQTVSLGEDATFSVQATGAAPLSYQWQRDGVDIAGATGASYTLTGATAADNGATFSVVVTNPFGSDASAAATLTVLVNERPTPTITTPTTGTLFSGGQSFNFSGTGTDLEDGVLGAAAFVWQVDYITGGVVRPFVPATPGVTSGSFTIPTGTPYTLTDVSYRVYLTVTDSQGASTTTTVDLLPVVVNLTLASSPAGLTLTLDGQPVTTPTVIAAVAGYVREVGAPTSTTLAGKSYAFASWSDGGAATHTITVPGTDTTFTASFTQVPPPPPPPPIPPPPPTTGPSFVASGNAGEAQSVFGTQITGTPARPFPDFLGSVRSAVGDFNGDGIADIAYVTGPGGGARLRLSDGRDGSDLLTASVVDTYAGEDLTAIGLFVAVGDIDGDGKAEVIVCPDQGGGARVQVFAVADGKLTQRNNFFGIEDPAFRGGGRVAVGDVNGDGRSDVIVGAGFSGGPRVAVYDGRDLRQKLFGDFLVFEPGLRDGVYVAAGDLNADGKADLVFGSGPGGGPRVYALDGARVLANVDGAKETPLANFFAFDPNQRNGVRVAVRRTDASSRPSLLAASADPANATIRIYAAADVVAASNGSEPANGSALRPFADGAVNDGIYVG